LLWGLGDRRDYVWGLHFNLLSLDRDLGRLLLQHNYGVAARSPVAVVEHLVVGPYFLFHLDPGQRQLFFELSHDGFFLQLGLCQGFLLQLLSLGLLVPRDEVGLGQLEALRGLFLANAEVQVGFVAVF
jgi:hypothetical protein